MSIDFIDIFHWHRTCSGTSPKGNDRSMILLGTDFSPIVMDVILTTDAVVLSLVVLVAFQDQVVRFCARVLHALWALVTAHPRHR